MTQRRKPPEGLTEAERKRWRDSYKNRNLHSVKFPDDLEADFQTWKAWHKIATDNAAITRLISTHPNLKQKPND